MAINMQINVNWY